MLRWFWWRINAWCEVVAMISSFGVSLGLVFAHRAGVNLGTHRELLLTVAATTVYDFFKLNEFLVKQGRKRLIVSETRTYSWLIRNSSGTCKHC